MRLPVSRASRTRRCVHAAPRSRRARPDASADRPRRADPCARAAGIRPRNGSGAAADRLEDVAHASSSSTSSEPVEEPMNTLTPAQPGSRSSSRQVLGVLARAADQEGEVAMHAVTAALDLVGQRLGAGGGRIGVRHLEHRGDAAQHRAARARFQVFLVGQARARGNAPGCRSRPAGRAGRGSRRSRRPRPATGRRWRRSGRRGCRCRARPRRPG